MLAEGGLNGTIHGGGRCNDSRAMADGEAGGPEGGEFCGAERFGAESGAGVGGQGTVHAVVDVSV